MISSTFSYADGKLNKILVTGHANYKKHGEDIVCAAVSASLIVTANAIEHLGLNRSIDLTVRDGYFQLILKEEEKTILALLKNLEYTLTDLQQQYPNYMKNQKEG
jgi:uncharacterized protein